MGKPVGRGLVARYMPLSTNPRSIAVHILTASVVGYEPPESRKRDRAPHPYEGLKEGRKGSTVQLPLRTELPSRVLFQTPVLGSLTVSGPCARWNALLLSPSESR